MHTVYLQFYKIDFKEFTQQFLYTMTIDTNDLDIAINRALELGKQAINQKHVECKSELKCKITTLFMPLGTLFQETGEFYPSSEYDDQPDYLSK